MPRITSRELATVIESSHQKAKRVAVMALGHDADTGQRSGRPRQFGFDGAFTVFLVVHLARNFRYKLKEAVKVAKDIMNILVDSNWVPSERVKFIHGRTTLVYEVLNYPTFIIDIGQDPSDEPLYRVKKILSDEEVPDAESEGDGYAVLRQQTYREYPVGKGLYSLKEYKRLRPLNLISEFAKGVRHVVNSRQ